MVKTMRQQILEYIQEMSKNLRECDLEQCTANGVSSRFMISRSLASQYLNDLAREDRFVKIKTRPVAFLSKYQLEKDSGKKIEQDSFLSYEELIRSLHGKQQNFAKAIGHQYALRDCIDKIKTAIDYPRGGLPVMIYGAHGSGKTFLAHRIRDYFFDQGLLKHDDQCVYLNCNRLDEGRLKYALFGYVDGQNKVCPGALHKAKDGLVILDDISFMGPDVQESLLQYLDQGTYCYAGSSKISTSGARLVLVAAEPPGKVFTSHFLDHFPSIIEIPPLKDRTIREKQALILHFFEQQALHSSCEILLGDKVVAYLMNQSSKCEVLFLKQQVTLIFARAYQKGEPQIRVGIDHISGSSDITDVYSDETYHPLEYYNYQEPDIYRKFGEPFGALYERYQEQEIDTERFCEESFQLVTKFNDLVIFNKDYLEMPLKRYEKYVDSVSDLTESTTNIRISDLIRSILAKYLYLQSYYPETGGYVQDMENVLESLEQIHPDAFAFTQEFSDTLERNFGMALSELHKIIFFLTQLLYSNDLTRRPTLALIMCHGNATASSIANVVNSLLAAHILDAFDMPLTSTVEDILVLVKDYLRAKRSYETLILIVDMGSLTRIAEELGFFEHVNVMLVSNVSTPLALHIGSMIQQDLTLEEIQGHLDEVKTECQIILKRNKEKAILFTSENGVDVADRTRLLFEKSIPIKTNLKLISCDPLHLAGKEGTDLFHKYDILFVEGIVDPKLPGIEFIDLGEIVSFQAMDRIDQLLGGFLSEEEMEIFRRNLLKNFSLENLMEALTILNPGPLLNMVEEAMLRLMQLIRYKIPEKTLIGLHVHVCCFVERMVTRMPVRTHEDLERFQTEEQEFIRKFLAAFEKIAGHYNIEIPMSEIAYIYDYIEMSKTVQPI